MQVVVAPTARALLREIDNRRSWLEEGLDPDKDFLFLRISQLPFLRKALPSLWICHLTLRGPGFTSLFLSGLSHSHFHAAR